MIVVTGGAGFIGSNIIKALNKKGINDILVVDNLRNGTKIINLTDLDISDYVDKKEYLKQIKFKKVFNHIDAIFHEGACSSTTEWNGKYIMYNNYQYSKELLHFCIKKNIPFLYASSGAVYGNYVKSDKHYKALNIYGYSKSLFDKYVYRLLPKAKSQIVGFRYFNVYGPNEQHKKSMASIIFHIYNQIKKNDNLKLFQGSENFKRDFIHIDDVVSVNLWFLENGISGIFDVGTGYAESFQTIAKIILNFYHKNNNIVYIPFPKNLKSYYQIFTQADLTNLRNVGYNKPFKRVNEGIKKYLFWLN